MEILVIIVIVLGFYINGNANKNALAKFDEEDAARHKKQKEEQEDYRRSKTVNFD